MISYVHMRLIFKVSDDSSGYPKYRTIDIPMSDRPKYRTIDIPMSDRMLESMTEQIACTDLGREPAVPIDPDSYLVKELERANVEIERLRAGYGECIGELAALAQPRDSEVTQRMHIIQRHRDILKENAKS